MKSERPKALVSRPDEGDFQTTIFALDGIFWALNMLVVHGAADDITHEVDRINGIQGLIAAGGRLTSEIKDRF